MIFNKVFAEIFWAVLIIVYGAVDGKGVIKTGSGAPVDSLTATLTAGPKGPVVIQDTILIDELAHFNRERIPERVVHAKGGGAFGFFECTHDVTKYTKLAPFAEIGKKTRVAARFSTVGGESGSADTLRDPRGFAVKFYTEDGIWDLVGLNTPVFFLRDPMLFPSLIHSQKRNPVTHLKDYRSFWDFITLTPETTYQTLNVFSEMGIPDGFRFMDGHPVHSFKLVNAYGTPYFCKFHFKAPEIRNLTADKAAELASSDPDYSIRDLYFAIDRKDFPTWTLFIQVLTYEQAYSYKYNPFDATKILPVKDFPLIEVGKLVLNENPINYFAQIEQLAYAPSNMIPGVEASPDKLLQARLFAYADTQRYRLGANHLQLPVNCPCNANVKVTNYQRDGAADYANYSLQGAPNYYPNSFGGPQPNPRVKISPYKVSGDVERYDTGNEDNYSQPSALWDSFDETQRTILVQNIVYSLERAHPSFIQKRAVEMFYKVNKELGMRVKEALAKKK
ncbi:catalase-like [Planococcus citri]|uniref:catalase-like n=1 Tax=Planococcus citri TaxID=170843 RepID=UPI0031F8C7C8